MLDDIKKILEISKKGIVIMEDGKPAYVVVPFEDYIENTKSAKKVSSDEEGNYLLDTIREDEKIFDEMIPAMEDIFEDELDIAEKEDVKLLNEVKKANIAKEKERVTDQKKDVREIRLEDLPF